MRADPLAHAGHQIADGLRGRDDVERRRQRALVVKVAQPQFGAGKLPLLVLVILPTPEKKKRQKCGGKFFKHSRKPKKSRSELILCLKKTASKVNKGRNNLTSGEHLWLNYKSNLLG